MLFFIWGILIFLAFLFPKSKNLSVVMIGFMILTIGFRTQGADYMIYQNEYEWSLYQIFSDVHYVGYLILEQFINGYGVTFSQFLVIVASVSCLFMYCGISRMTNKVNIVLSFFLIYPFSHEGVQTRTFLANSLLILALPLVLKEPLELSDQRKGLLNKKFFRLILFYLLAVIACSLHFEAVIYIALISLMLFLPQKYGKLYIITGTIGAFLLIETGLLSRIAIHFNSRIAYWVSGKTGLGIVIPIFITFIIWYAMHLTGKSCVDITLNNSYENTFYKKLYRFSDFIFLIIPLFCYDITFNRTWRLFLIVLYIMTAKSLSSKIGKNTKLWILSLLIIIFVLICSYERVFSVLVGFFKNNAILGNLSTF